MVWNAVVRTYRGSEVVSVVRPVLVVLVVVHLVVLCLVLLVNLRTWLLDYSTTNVATAGRSQLRNIILRQRLTLVILDRFVLTRINGSASRPSFVGHFVLVIWTSLFERFPLLVINLTVAIARHVGTPLLIQMMTHFILCGISRSSVLISFPLPRLSCGTQTEIWKRVIWSLLVVRWRDLLTSVIFGILNSVFVRLALLRLIGCIPPEIVSSFWVNGVIRLVRIPDTRVDIGALHVLHGVRTSVIVVQHRQIVDFSKFFGTFTLNHISYNNLKL